MDPAMLGQIGLLVVMLAVMYFILIRPENKKKKEVEKMRSNLGINDEVVTIGGVIGTICFVDDKDDSIVLETGADRVRVKFKKWAISTKNVNASEPTGK